MNRLAVAVLLLVTLVACSSESKSASGTTTTVSTVVGQTTTTDVPFHGSSAPVATADTPPATLTALGIEVHDGFERVLFTFADHVPGILIQPSPGPFARGQSDETIHVNGTAYLAMRMTANGHDETGHSASNERTPGPAGKHSITEVVRTDDFEGVLTYVVGLDSPQTFRVLQYSNPPRLAIDVSSG